ncbi:hypothetical protein, partial [Enterococcus faecium]|uniref:hypothetical protein n=1 Tax=Enterococcus faecium TaxID=1352 RepID=UPI001C6113A1
KIIDAPKNLTTFENFRHKIFTTNDYYISIPTNNPNNTFSFLTPYPASSPASRTFFYQKNLYHPIDSTNQPNAVML